MVLFILISSISESNDISIVNPGEWFLKKCSICYQIRWCNLTMCSLCANPWVRKCESVCFICY